MSHQLPPGNNTEWDENGCPVNRSRPPVADDFIKSYLHKAAQENVYEGKRDDEGYLKPGEEKFIGRPVIQVAIDRQLQKAGEGDLQAYNAVMDRTVGKPKQTIEQTGTVTLTMQDWIADRVAANPDFLASISAPMPAIEISTPTSTSDVVDVERVIDREALKSF